MGRYNTMRSREYSGAFVPLNIDHPCRQSTLLLNRAIVLRSMLWKRGHRQLHVANGMLEMG